MANCHLIFDVWRHAWRNIGQSFLLRNSFLLKVYLKLQSIISIVLKVLMKQCINPTVSVDVWYFFQHHLLLLIIPKSALHFFRARWVCLCSHLSSNQNLRLKSLSAFFTWKKSAVFGAGPVPVPLHRVRPCPGDLHTALKWCGPACLI